MRIQLSKNDVYPHRSKIINDIIDLHHSERKVSDELIFNELNLKTCLFFDLLMIEILF